MADPVVVKSNVGVVDGVQAALRYIAVLVGFVTALLALVKARDLAGIAAYVQSNLGSVIGAVSGLISLAIAAYGVVKSFRRGKQLADAGADPRNKTITTI